MSGGRLQRRPRGLDTDGGEYVEPGEASPAVLKGRRRFLRIVGQCVPAVLETLGGDVYRALVEGARSKGAAPSEVLDMVRYLHPISNLDYGREFAGALERWQTQWNLVEPWVWEAAVASLSRWDSALRRHPDSALTEPIFWPGLWANGWLDPLQFSANHQHFRFEHSWWLPTKLSRATYQEQIRAAFEDELRAYIDRVEALADAAGLRKVKRKRPRRGETPELHFEWLARFQVQEWTHKEIAERYRNVDPKTVAAACRNVSEMIGLTRRSVTPQ